jgi:hypothetical protein
MEGADVICKSQHQPAPFSLQDLMGAITPSLSFFACSNFCNDAGEIFWTNSKCHLVSEVVERTDLRPVVHGGTCWINKGLLQPQASPKHSPTRGGQADSGGYEVQSTYFPAQSTGYVPPHPSTSDPFAQADVPYGGSSMGGAGAGGSMHSAYGQQHQAEVVPAVMPSPSAPHAGAASGQTVLQFQGATFQRLLRPLHMHLARVMCMILRLLVEALMLGP